MALVNLTKIKAGEWTLLADDAAPAGGDTVAVPLARLKAEGDFLFATNAKIGAVIPSDTPFAALEGLTDKLAFAVVQFGGFGDGRGFSLAVRLRKDYGFKGEIRAAGPVIPDQALYLLRAGFDTVDVREERKAAFEANVERYGVFYQSDFNGQVSVAHLRHRPREERKAS